MFKGWCAALLLSTAIEAKAQNDWNYIDRKDIVSADSISQNNYTLIFINKQPAFDEDLRRQMIDCFFKVYPQEVTRFHRHSAKKVTFVVDPRFDGIAATMGSIVRFNPKWFEKFPGISTWSPTKSCISSRVIRVTAAPPG